jgi:nucleotide-binding universal stress UspA family protein
MESELLITTNGFKGTWPAIEYGAWFAEMMRMKVTLLGVTEKQKPAGIAEAHLLEDMFKRAVELFQQRKLEYSLDFQNGEAEQVIPEKAQTGGFITVVSPLGRSHFKRLLRGRSVRSLMEKIKGPLLYVPEVRLPLNKILISAGGLGYEVEAENLAFQIASASKADVSILHVVPPTDHDYPTTRDIRGHISHLADTDTLLGRGLRRALDLAKKKGLKAKVISRQGNVVEEILTEIVDGNYDLACMGSPYSAHALRQFYSPNVTAEVAVAARCPVLTARHVSA